MTRRQLLRIFACLINIVLLNTNSLTWPVAFAAESHMEDTKTIKTSVTAQPLTLNEVIAQALKNYPSLKEASARYQAAQAGIGVSKTAYLPSLDVFVQNTLGTYNRLPGLSFSQAGMMPVAGPTPSSQVNSFVFGHSSGALLTWNAYDFGYRKAEVERSRVEAEVAKASQSLTEIDVVSQAIAAYLQAQTAQHVMEASTANLERTMVFQNSVSVLVKSGLRPGIDHSRALAEMAMAKTRLIQAQRQVEVAQAILAECIGLAGETVSLQKEPFISRIPLARPITQDSTTLHPLLSVQSSQIKLVQASEKALQRANYPKVYLQTGVNGRGSELNAQGDEDSASKGLFPTRANLGVGMTVAYTPSNILINRAKLKQMKFQEDAEKARYEKTLQELTGSFAQAKAQIKAAIQIAQHTPLVVQVAQQSEIQSRARYKAGLATLVDVADAQRTLVNAQIDDALAKLGVWTAMLSASKAQGRLEPFINLTQAKES